MFKDSDSIPAVPETSKALTTPSWEVELPASCDDPDQAEELYHNAHLWIAELRSRTEPPAYPLRTLMNVVNVADLIRDNYPERAYTLEDALKELELEPGELSKDMQKCLGQIALAIHNFYHPKTDAAPAKTIMEQFNQQNLPVEDDIILNQSSKSRSQRLMLKKVRKQTRQDV